MTVILILILFLIVSGISNYKICNRDSLCIFNMPGISAVDIYDHRKHYFLTPDTTGRMNDILYNASGYWMHNYSRYPEFITITKDSRLPEGFFTLPGEGNYLFHGSAGNIAVIQDTRSLARYSSRKKIFVEFLILGGNNPGSVPDCFEVGKVILDSSVPWFTLRNRSSDSLFSDYFIVSEEGAFVVEF